jgi:hypothetical protein
MGYKRATVRQGLGTTPCRLSALTAVTRGMLIPVDPLISVAVPIIVTGCTAGCCPLYGDRGVVAPEAPCRTAVCAPACRHVQERMRFAGSRLVEPHAVARLAESIERCGQIVPCVVVVIPGGEVMARRRWCSSTATGGLPRCAGSAATPPGIELWCCGLTQALLGVLARAQDCPFASIEQALLLRALMAGQGLSQHEMAQRCGRADLCLTIGGNRLGFDA